MPIVMTGSPGGAIGGPQGPAFGSGIQGLSSPPKKIFTPGLEVWNRRHEEDVAMMKERKGEYSALRDARLAQTSHQKKAVTDRKHKQQDDFAKRQAARLAAEKEEKQRQAAWRKESIEKNLKEFARQGEPGYGPTRWCWPTAHHYPRHCNGTGGAGVGENDVLLTAPLLQPGGMVAGFEKDLKNDLLLIHSDRKFLPQQGETELRSLAETLPDKLEEMKQREAKVRQMRREAELAEEEEKKREREAEAVARQAEMQKKQAEAKKKEVARSRQIKKEMAEETRKLAKEHAEKEMIRYEKAQTERAEMVRHLKMDMTLRDEDEIANERREGSSMSKGGKADFQDAMRSDDKSDDKAFM